MNRPGQPLSPSTRAQLETQFGADLSDVRVHTDETAARAVWQTRASAFAFGRHIAFGQGQFAPATTDGYRRLAHEVTHILQQRGGSSARPDLRPVDSLETEAREAAQTASQNPRARVHIPPSSAARGRVQRDDPPPFLNRPDLLHPWTSQGQFQLQISPEMQRIIFEIEFERWLTAQATEHPPDAVPPLSTSAGALTSSTADPVVPSPADAAEAVEAHTPLVPSIRPTLPFPSRDMGADQPDMGAIMTPFLMRNVPLGSRDPDAAAQLYWNAYQWVRWLPAPPEPFRSWIPSNWRSSLSASFAAMAINNSPLRLEFPTPTEEFDRNLLNMYNDPSVVPTYINLPPLYTW